MNATLHRLSGCISLFLLFVTAGRVFAQQSDNQILAATNSPDEQIVALQLQLTNAWHQVETVVNQPVRAYRRAPGYDVSVYHPGWFHPEANTPDFSNVDVRRSQELIYTSTWVSSDVTPGLMFRGSDLEFNAMTKLFYTNRMLPKKRLTEDEMVQINSLYRTIGHCQSQILRLQNPPTPEAATTETQDETNDVATGQAFAFIRRIPQQKRILYGGIAIGTLLVLAVALRLARKKSN